MIQTSVGWLHTLDPFAVQFSESFGIRWYGLAYLAGFAITYWFATWLAQRGRTKLPAALVGDFVFCAAIGTVLGGRLGYCCLYDPSLLTHFSGSFPYWGALMIHHGGMASHGGILGLLLACAWFARRHKTSFPSLLDLTVTGGTLGIFFGRIANFVNGELVGRPAAGDVTWAVRFPQDLLLWPTYEPERLASLSNVVPQVGISSPQWEQALAQSPHSSLIGMGIERLIARLQAGDTQLAELLSPLLTPRYPSQLVAALLEGLALFIVSSILWSRGVREGIVAGTFLMLYPVMRVLSEGYRMPDVQLGFQLWGLTRGQWLSVVMFLVCAIGLWWWSRRNVPSTGDALKDSPAKDSPASL